MKYFKRFTAVMVLAFLIVGVVSALPAETRTQPAKATQPAPFDYSQCQYPSRTTNPPNGCDNSDPATPYCAVKGLPEDCTDPNAEPQPVAPTPTVTPAQPPQAAQCGGK